MTDITVSELLTFLRCRRKWDYSSHNRQSLGRVGPPRLSMHIGTLVHAGIEAYIKSGDGWQNTLRASADERFEELQQTYRSVVGCGMSSVEMGPFREAVDKAVRLVVRYIDKWGNEAGPTKGYRWLPELTETTFRVPLPGTEANLAGTFDAVAVGPDNKLYIVDHKTYSNKPANEDYDLTFQFMCYQWAASRLWPNQLGGFIYDGISNKLPDAPSLLKSGKLSTAHLTTKSYSSYMTAILEHDLDPADYQAQLDRLQIQERGPETPWHRRYVVKYNRRLIQSLTDQLPRMWFDMRHARIYPNYRFEGCWDCSYKGLCHAEQYGEDHEAVRQREYARSGGYGTTKALTLTPETAKDPLA